MKHLRLLLLSALPLLVAACASSSGTSPQQAASDSASGSFKPVPGTAGLYIFKDGSLIGVVDSTQVGVDGQMLGLVASSAYLYASLTPGSHVVTSGTSQVTINVQAGQNYFVQQKPNLNQSGQIVSSTVVAVPAETGLQAVKQIQLSSFAH